MKKFIFALLGLYCLNGFGQTILSAHYLNLKKPLAKQQFLTAVNAQNQQVFVVASDKETQTAYKYNSALFFKDSLSGMRPVKDEYPSLSGYSFDDAGNPEVYWTSDDYKKILAVRYNFEIAAVSELTYSMDLKEEEITNSFSENNIFYILTAVKAKPFLKIYMFQNGKMELKTLDFSTFNLTNADNQPVDFEKIINQDPIEKVDTKALNPLLTGVKKSKLFVYPDKFILTFDCNPALTQIFEVDLTTFSITEKSVPQQPLTKKSKSNSYYHEGKLYQLSITDTEIALSATDLSTDGIGKLKTYHITEKDAITFKNSPLYAQTGNQRSRELKNTQKFLRRVYDSNIGLTAYQTPNEVLLTVGGIRDVSSTGDILLGVTVGVGMVMAGSGAAIDGLLSTDVQAVYFESLFNKQFEHSNLEQQRLGSDYISQFLQEHDDISPATIFPYRDFFIMGYYDTASKQYIMRKFQDDGF